jgi:hypothetical protein
MVLSPSSAPGQEMYGLRRKTVYQRCSHINDSMRLFFLFSFAFLITLKPVQDRTLLTL